MRWKLKLREGERFAQVLHLQQYVPKIMQNSSMSIKFHISDSHCNARDLHQYSPIIITVWLKVNPHQTLIYVEIPELLLSPRSSRELCVVIVYNSGKGICYLILIFNNRFESLKLRPGKSWQSCTWQAVWPLNAQATSTWY